MQLICNQRLADILVHQKLNKERYLLADYLYYLKRETRIYGNKNVKLL